MSDFKKKYLIPVAEIINLENNDIITASDRALGGDDWDEYPDKETW